MSRQWFGLVAAIAIVVAACGGVGGGSFDRDGDEPFLQISSEGGFAPIEVLLNSGPRYTILGDGRLIFPGVQTMQYPGPLLPQYLVTKLDENQMNAILAIVGDMGLAQIEDEIDNSAASTIADATTEVVTHWDENGSHRLAVYALGMVESPSSSPNTAFVELIQTLDQFTAQAVGDPYVAERTRIIAGPASVDPQFEDHRAWPLNDTDFSDWVELSDLWHCTVIGGQVPSVFEDATQATTWTSPSNTSMNPPLQLLVRSLHPGEPDCPS